MRFFYGKQDMPTLERGEEFSFMATNGLGGYASTTAAFSVPRCDQGLLIAAVKAPNERITMVHRLRETLTLGQSQSFLSSQSFPDGTAEEDGYKQLSSFTYEFVPQWTYQIRGVQVVRSCAMVFEENATGIIYRIENRTRESCTLILEPFVKMAPKESALEEAKPLRFDNGAVTDGTYTLYIRTNGALSGQPVCWQTLSYPEDARDGRPDTGLAGSCCRIEKTVAPGETAELQLIFAMTRTDRDILIAFMNSIQYITVSHDLLFITVSRCCLFHEQLLNSGTGGYNSLDFIRSFCTLDFCNFN